MGLTTHQKSQASQAQGCLTSSHGLICAVPPAIRLVLESEAHLRFFGCIFARSRCFAVSFCCLGGGCAWAGGGDLLPRVGLLSMTATHTDGATDGRVSGGTDTSAISTHDVDLSTHGDCAAATTASSRRASMWRYTPVGCVGMPVELRAMCSP